MTTDELDEFEPKEQSKGSAPKASNASSVPPETSGSSQPETVTAASTAGATQKAGAPSTATPRSLPHFGNPFSRVRIGSSMDPKTFRFGLAFAIGAIGSLFVVMVLAMGLSGAYSNKVVPGVKVGSVDVSGMNRDEVIAKLQSAYAYLGKGQVTVTTPVGNATITYQEADRKPDVEVMADAAMSIGHSGNPIGDAASILRSAITGQSVPVVVHVDPMALATRLRLLVGTSAVPPQDAQVTLTSGTFAFSPSTPGRGIDESAISSSIIDRLVQSDAPADLQAGGTFVALDPQVSDKDAQDAIAAAQKMVVDVSLIWSGPLPVAPDPSAAPTATQTPFPPKTYTVPAATIRSWIVFGTKTDGTYGPAADPALVQQYLSTLSGKIAIQPVEPSVLSDSSGTPIGLKAGKQGTGIDVGATSQAIEIYLDSLVSGKNPGSTIAIAAAPISPQITDVHSLDGMVKIGAWTTTFFPGESNFNGQNIRVPAAILNGQVVAPGQQFSFLEAVGPIDAAHGFGLGGVIVGGKSNHTGAMGGGICSASTTMFNAAAMAGLQIDERHNHSYYINRYPIGRDATVYSNGTETLDLRWTNDTPAPIVIRGYSTRGSNSKVTFELWSLPVGRKTVWTGGAQANLITATDGKLYVSTLAPGKTYRAEFPTEGFDTSVTRTVTDASGNVLHTNTWKSHYIKVDGVLQIGGTPPPSQTPTPSPGAPTPTPTPAPVVTPTPAPVSPSPRRRKVR